MLIFCCGCQAKVDARLTNGKEIYPHREDLYSKPFWRCDGCKNYVGCHYKTTNPTNPLGNIPTPRLRTARQEIHKLLDPLWQGGGWSRKDLYNFLSAEMGFKYHTAKIRNLNEAEKVWRLLRGLVAKKNEKI